MKAPTAGLTLDSGALLALDQPSKALVMQARLEETRRRGGTLCVPAGAVAQAWRGPRQVRLARLLKASDVDVAVMTLGMARAVGLVCAQSGHGDVIDVHVVLRARHHHHAVATTDPDDIAHIDPGMPVIRV